MFSSILATSVKTGEWGLQFTNNDPGMQPYHHTLPVELHIKITESKSSYLYSCGQGSSMGLAGRTLKMP